MNLLLGLILGLVALVHSSPINAVTQMPAKGEDDVLREAITDGFLVDHMYFPSSTTESPKRNTTVRVTQQPSEIEEENTQTTTNELVVFEASGAEGSGEESSTAVQQRDEQSTSTKPSLLPIESLSTLSPDSISHFTQSPVFGSGDGETGSTPDTPLSTTSSSTPDLNPTSYHYNTEQHTPAEASTVPSTSTATLVTHKAPRMLDEMEESGSGIPIPEEVSTVETIGNEAHRVEVPAAMLPPEGHSTPGWIIILGFVVGLAATVMVCVAIATRDKWNGPSQATQVGTKVNSTNQPREQEMETFLQKQAPRENGQTAEYTVIPLEDLPEKDLLH